jgi:hypothetical protein
VNDWGMKGGEEEHMKWITCNGQNTKIGKDSDMNQINKLDL